MDASPDPTIQTIKPGMRQAEDDPALLELMLTDYASTLDFRATARWADYSDRFVSFLKNEGLRDFRSRRHPKGSPGAVLAAFGALDINPTFDRASPADMFHAAATCYLGEGAKSIRDLLPSQVGSPQGFEVEGRFYTLSWLNYYCRYAYVSKFMEFSNQIIVEVGPGAGKQAEMLKKAHPDLTLILFDLPTQLYVTNQYLSAVFGDTDAVVDYRAGRTISSFQEIQRGKINILPHWKFPIVRNQAFDLLWNAASFQEMGPETASAYLRDASGAERLFLMYNIKYREGAPLPGARGVMDPKILNSHNEIDRVAAKLALTPSGWLYFDSFWAKAAGSSVPSQQALDGEHQSIARGKMISTSSSNRPLASGQSLGRKTTPSTAADRRMGGPLRKELGKILQYFRSRR